MADKLNTNGTQQWIRADQLIIDPLYQRKLNIRKVRKIVNGFDADAFGVLLVSKRNGVLAILDGQQRHAAILEMGWDDQLLPCMVYTDLTVAQEAALFVQYNELRTKPRPMELHDAQLVAEDPRAVAVAATVESLGLVVRNGPVAGYVQCVSALYDVLDNTSAKNLHRTLSIILAGYGQRSDGFHRDVVLGIAIILARHGKMVNDARMANVLAKHEPKALLRKARVMKGDIDSAGGGSMSRVAAVVASILVRAYNTRLAKERRIHFDTTLTGRPYWTEQQ